jgi:hypothetical protein
MLKKRRHIKIVLLLIITLPFSFSSISQIYVSGETYLDTTGFVEYWPGNLPVIISVPHGGLLQPDSIPDLSCEGTPNQFIDSYTSAIGEGLYNTFFERTGCYPHMVFSWLHKKKFEPNKNLQDGACGNPTVESAWLSYHAFIDSAKAKIIEDYGRGLFLDIHGHAHTIERIEYGYLLSRSELQLSDSALNTTSFIEESSIRTLVGDNLNNLSHADLLRGPTSFGAIMDNKDFPGVPSQYDPFPQGSEPYFTGGYLTMRHGSRDNNGEIDGIQIEFNQDIRFDASTREILIDSLTSGINEFINTHYNNQYLNNYCGLLSSTEVNKKSSLKLFPNPSKDHFYLSGEIEGSKLIIVNHLGKKVIEEQWSNDRVDIEILPPGLYFVQVVKDNRMIDVLKLIKQ